LSESGFAEFKDSQDSAGGKLDVCLMFAAAESCESLNSENPDSDKKRHSGMQPAPYPIKKLPPILRIEGNSLYSILISESRGRTAILNS
jgi:hypothetical protein